MTKGDKEYSLYQVILLVFFVVQTISSFVLLFVLDMHITGSGFLLSSVILFVSYFIARRGRLHLSVHLICQIFPILFLFGSIYGKLHGEGTSLVYYIAPRFGILITIILPFFVLGATNVKKLFFASIPGLFWFLTFDIFHRLFGLGSEITFKQSDYPLVVLGSFAILVLALSIIYALQITNEKFQQQILNQKNELQLVHKKITASIDYASRIQQTLLVGEDILRKNFSEFLILYKPKDIVSGDFYWLKKKSNKIFCMVADCTGHGVPGAFVSMLGIAFLNEITDLETKTAAEVLEHLRLKVEKNFTQNSKRDVQDGMDAAFCIFDLQTKLLNFSGAKNPVVIVRQNEVIEYKGTRNSIGVNYKTKPFENHFIQLERNDMIFAFSDGYMDQVGGDYNLRIMKKGFYELLKQNSALSMREQEALLNEFFDSWKNGNAQIDDVTVLGVKI